jgi:hypothetical protein
LQEAFHLPWHVDAQGAAYAYEEAARGVEEVSGPVVDPD